MLMVALKKVLLILICCLATYSEAATYQGQYIDLQIEKFVINDYFKQYPDACIGDKVHTCST